jgi:Cu-processing system permease protein
MSEISLSDLPLLRSAPARADSSRRSAVLPRTRPRSTFANVVTIARRELRDAIRSRWFLLYTLTFAALGVGVSYVSASSAGGSGLAGFGRTSAGMINLVLLIVPLMALTAGAGAIASDRERGMLPYLLAQPISRFEVLMGKYVGLAVTLATSISLGFGACAAVLSYNGASTDPRDLATLVGLTVLLALAMLSLGFLLSTLARKTSVAVGTAVFLWFAMVFLTDLGLMAGAIAMKLSIERLFAIAAASPLQVFKMWSLQTVAASLDVLGPAGLYAQETLGARLNWIFAGVLAAWMIVPLSAAAFIFNRRSPV